MKRTFGKDRICGVIAAATAREMIAQIRLAGRNTANLELRLDYLRNAKERDNLLAKHSPSTLRRAAPSCTLIATCRTRAGGGKFSGTLAAQIKVLRQAVRAGCDWCDVEIETASRMRPGELQSTLAPARIMISFHNFSRTPPKLPDIVRRLLHQGGEVAKVATHCHSFADIGRVCDLPRGLSHERHDVVAIPMGEEAGVAGRILALRAGSALAYAAVESTTAPGQISLEMMRNLYRADHISERTRVYGVIGNPVGHSLSPLLHNTAFRLRMDDAVLVPFLVTNLGPFLRFAGAFGLAGFAVTIPHKEAILRHLDDCDPLARKIGAVNTVVVRGGRLYGYNTDYLGVLRSLERRLTLQRARILLFGAGGAARAAAFALRAAGAEVCISARQDTRARQLAVASGTIAVERTRIRHEQFDAIVNCTPVGMRASPGSPLASAELNCRIVMDMVYRPRNTELLRLARRKKIATISGLEMFLAQGAEQYKIWSGHAPPESAMRRAVTAVLQLEESP